MSIIPAAVSRQKVLTRRTDTALGLLPGPSESPRPDLLGMAVPRARVAPWPEMTDQDRSTHPGARPSHHYRRDIVRALAVILAVVALLVTSSALNWVTEARAADDGPKKAVIVSGPVHGLTARYKDYAKAMADAAEAQGMDVVRIFHPYAPKSRVKKHANGADLFIYVGHGNGWPSPFGPFQEDTKNGLGLDPEDPDKRGPNTVVYKGANWLRDNIELAPNAVVILSHLSYASGNASSGMPIPSRSVAVERVDNFANGFLAIGAQVVWALGWQPGADVIDALHQEDATMNAVFMTRYRSSVSPLNGWIGIDPGVYESVRTPGAQVHIDPHPEHGYLRGLTGNLAFTTTEWRDAEDLPPDMVPPVISAVSATQAPATVATGGSELPVFTPNGDGISDAIKVSHRLSENAFLMVKVKKDGNVVRQWSVWSLKGKGSTFWDGRRDGGNYVGEGTFKIVLTPTDRAGNQGDPAEVRVKALNSIKNPTVNPPLFDATDADELAPSSALKARLTREATVSWLVKDRSGTVVRRGIDAQVYPPGDVRFVWDGTDDAGQLVPEGRYTGRIRVTRPGGTYAHDVTVRMMPFKLWSAKWTLKRGASTKLSFESAEPLKGKPVVTANQPGIRKYGLKVTRRSPTKFTATLRTRNKGKAGDLKVRIVGTDVNGGSQSKVFTLKLR